MECVASCSVITYVTSTLTSSEFSLSFPSSEAIPPAILLLAFTQRFHELIVYLGQIVEELITSTYPQIPIQLKLLVIFPTPSANTSWNYFHKLRVRSHRSREVKLIICFINIVDYSRFTNKHQLNHSSSINRPPPSFTHIDLKL